MLTTVQSIVWYLPFAADGLQPMAMIGGEFMDEMMDEDSNDRSQTAPEQGSSLSRVPRRRSKKSQQQLRRDHKIVRNLMHPQHKMAFGLWVDQEGVLRGCGPMQQRETVLRSVAAVLGEMKTNSRGPGCGSDGNGGSAAGGSKNTFSAPEDAVSGPLDKNRLVRLLVLLGWKRLYEAHKHGDFPEHMEKYRDKSFWTRVAKLPRGKAGAWHTSGAALDSWKQDARALLTMTAWSEGDEADCEGQDEDPSGRKLMWLDEVCNIKPGKLTAQKFATLVACVGIFLEWFDPGEFDNAI